MDEHVERMEKLTGTITHYMGNSYTGNGVKNFYNEIIQEAYKVYFFKGPLSLKVSTILKEVGYAASRRGKNTEWFYNPLHEDILEGIYIVDNRTLYLQSDDIDPSYYGAGHEWVLYYEAYDERKLRDIGPIIRDKQIANNVWLTKGLQALSRAKTIHDDWEQIIAPSVNWNGIDELLERLIKEAIGNIKLQKRPEITHRLMGSLTPLGAEDTFKSISARLKTRLYIKGLPGSGKSTFMKKFADEAKNHGLDVRYIWCGLDANSVDGIILSELQLCVVDATAPHIHDPEREGDEILDFFAHIDQSLVDDEALLQIREVYVNEIEIAQDYISTYAEDLRIIKKLYDSAIDGDKWRALENKMIATVE